MKTLIAWFARLFKKETPVTDPVVVTQPADAVPAAAPVAPVVAPVVVPAAATPSTFTLDTEKLKNLLITLGHDIEADWDSLLALAKKKI